MSEQFNPYQSPQLTGQSGDHAIEIANVSKNFGPIRALDNVSFQIRRGQIHCLVGANGAGKSTLMKILDGVYPTGSYRGTICVNGQPAEMRSPHDAKRQGIGYVPQEISVIEALSVAENIFVGQVRRPGRWWVSQRELKCALLLERGARANAASNLIRASRSLI